MQLVPFISDDTTFYGILVRHMCHLLVEREADLNETNWVIGEAKDLRKLQTGGTFRSIIIRRMEDIVVPILAEIIVLIDKNCNLDLLWNRDKKCLIPQSSSTVQFWLAMFQESQVMRLQYKDLIERGNELEGLERRMPGKHFRCKLPFSWLVCEAFEGQWPSTKSSAGINCLNV